MKLPSNHVLFFATGAYAGKVPIAPGTFGTLVGLPICFIFSLFPWPLAIVLMLGFILFSIWIANEAEKLIHQKDPGCIVIDEIAGIIITFIALPFDLVYVIAGFIIFRLIDIGKPFPIRYLEKRFTGGLGIVIDDVAAGIFGNMILRLVIAYV